jgi:LDH2 family malate/lactate/ureidoglycolate dehydrogenase
MDNWIARFRTAQPIDPLQKVLIPGDPERETEQIRRQDGIPLIHAVVEDLRKLSEKLNIDHPF